MKKTNILIVEDDNNVANLEKIVLSDAGYNVSIAENPEKMWSILKEEEISLIFMDYKIPESDIMELLSILVYTYPGIPIVMITGYGEESTVIEAFKRGVKDYIVKDYKADYLLQLPKVASELLQKTEDAKHDILKARNCVIFKTIMDRCDMSLVVSNENLEVLWYNKKCEETPKLKKIKNSKSLVSILNLEENIINNDKSEIVSKIEDNLSDKISWKIFWIDNEDSKIIKKSLLIIMGMKKLK
ncbi:MAG: response regulator [Candidatus Coatesbacteria bacterium]|nr:response regulator [Candidatus Coatesbacteria bacterium]